jgi:2-polyprenyl-3-methyl-5-hydroxy-6-metoxy-1,4-benzoquinol methylase
MGRSPVEISICSTESESWDTIWKWTWFRREAWWAPYRQELEPFMRDLFALLRRHGVRSVLDASCGLGAKTILLAEQRFEVEGADLSSVAAEYAPRLAAEKGMTIRFFNAGNSAPKRVMKKPYNHSYATGR